RACAFCRVRKLRCDKQVPKCSSCQRLGRECLYTLQRSLQSRPRAKPTHVQSLEDRLRMFHLL
ncbi:hypothetical protein OIDMADRAFT_87098, partial [Oidiodendron maius Zn]